VLNHLSVELKDVKVTARLVTPSSKKTLPLPDCRIERGATLPGAQAADVLPQVERKKKYFVFHRFIIIIIIIIIIKLGICNQCKKNK
jgi:hypothetical protein